MSASGKRHGIGKLCVHQAGIMELESCVCIKQASWHHRIGKLCVHQAGIMESDITEHIVEPTPRHLLKQYDAPLSSRN